MNDDDDEESLLDKIRDDMEEERWKKRRVPGAFTETPGPIDGTYPAVCWLQGSTIEILQHYLDFLAKADDVVDCARRMRLLADSLHDEADKLMGKGAMNFHRSYELH